MTHDNKKYIELAKKLKALSDKGVGGERAAAKLKLERLMTERGLSMEDIEGVERKIHWFVAKLTDQKFFWQIVASVLGDYSGYDSRSKRTKKGVVCTAAEAIEIEHKFQFYLSVYKKEHTIFYRAFVQANELYRKTSDEDSDVDVSQSRLTAEDRAVIKMASTMDKNHFLKQLKGL